MHLVVKSNSCSSTRSAFSHQPPLLLAGGVGVWSGVCSECRRRREQGKGNGTVAPRCLVSLSGGAKPGAERGGQTRSSALNPATFESQLNAPRGERGSTGCAAGDVRTQWETTHWHRPGRGSRIIFTPRFCL